jgi:hypothetical protein
LSSAVSGRPSHGTSSKDAIDAVYLWVDSSTAAFRQAFEAYGPTASQPADSDAQSENRFRDNGELRFSLRSLERFAPWIRRIYIVTNGEVPKWLVQPHPRVTIIPHDSLFLRKSDLPTFNSNAIELQLHRIPDLSDRFLYFNDDLFLLGAISPDTFLLPGGAQRFFLERRQLHDRTDLGPVHDRAYAYSQQVVDRTLGRHRPRFLPCHVPQIYDKNVIADLERTFRSDFEITASHRFRSEDDLVLRILYASWILEGHDKQTSEAVSLEPAEYCFVPLGTSAIMDLRRLLRVALFRPRFFCLNDDVRERSASRQVLKLLPAYLRLLYPAKSTYEK